MTIKKRAKEEDSLTKKGMGNRQCPTSQRKPEPNYPATKVGPRQRDTKSDSRNGSKNGQQSLRDRPPKERLSKKTTKTTIQMTPKKDSRA